VIGVLVVDLMVAFDVKGGLICAVVTDSAFGSHHLQHIDLRGELQYGALRLTIPLYLDTAKFHTSREPRSTVKSGGVD